MLSFIEAQAIFDELSTIGVFLTSHSDIGLARGNDWPNVSGQVDTQIASSVAKQLVSQLIGRASLVRQALSFTDLYPGEDVIGEVVEDIKQAVRFLPLGKAVYESGMAHYLKCIVPGKLSATLAAKIDEGDLSMFTSEKKATWKHLVEEVAAGNKTKHELFSILDTKLEPKLNNLPFFLQKWISQVADKGFHSFRVIYERLQFLDLLLLQGVLIGRVGHLFADASEFVSRVSKVEDLECGPVSKLIACNAALELLDGEMREEAGQILEVVVSYVDRTIEYDVDTCVRAMKVLCGYESAYNPADYSKFYSIEDSHNGSESIMLMNKGINDIGVIKHCRALHPVSTPFSLLGSKKDLLPGAVVAELYGLMRKNRDTLVEKTWAYGIVTQKGVSKALLSSEGKLRLPAVEATAETKGSTFSTDPERMIAYLENNMLDTQNMQDEKERDKWLFDLVVASIGHDQLALRAWKHMVGLYESGEYNELDEVDDLGAMLGTSALDPDDISAREYDHLVGYRKLEHEINLGNFTAKPWKGRVLDRMPMVSEFESDNQGFVIFFHEEGTLSSRPKTLANTIKAKFVGELHLGRSFFKWVTRVNDRVRGLGELATLELMLSSDDYKVVGAAVSYIREHSVRLDISASDSACFLQPFASENGRTVIRGWLAPSVVRRFDVLVDPRKKNMFYLEFAGQHLKVEVSNSSFAHAELVKLGSAYKRQRLKLARLGGKLPGIFTPSV